MRTIGLRYATGQALKQDVQTAFPEWDGNVNDVPTWLERHCYAKGRVRNEQGNVIGWDVYLLVREDFQIPNWIQGVELQPSEYQHNFLGIV